MYEGCFCNIGLRLVSRVYCKLGVGIHLGILVMQFYIYRSKSMLKYPVYNYGKHMKVGFWG